MTARSRRNALCHNHVHWSHGGSTASIRGRNRDNLVLLSFNSSAHHSCSTMWSKIVGISVGISEQTLKLLYVFEELIDGIVLTPD